MDKSSGENLDRVFAALADSTRRAILCRLIAGEASVSELGRPFQLAQPTVSKHLKVLEDAGLVARGRDAQWRPRQLAPAPLKEVADWLEPFRREWEARLSNLDRYVTAMNPKGGHRGVGKHKNNR